jgi:hypothetical protein
VDSEEPSSSICAARCPISSGKRALNFTSRILERLLGTRGLVDPWNEISLAECRCRCFGWAVTIDRRRFAGKRTSFLLLFLLGAVGSFARLGAFGHANPILSQLKEERFVPQTCRLFRQASTICGVPAIPFGRVHHHPVASPNGKRLRASSLLTVAGRKAAGDEALCAHRHRPASCGFQEVRQTRTLRRASTRLSTHAERALRRACKWLRTSLSTLSIMVTRRVAKMGAGRLK